MLLVKKFIGCKWGNFRALRARRLPNRANHRPVQPRDDPATLHSVYNPATREKLTFDGSQSHQGLITLDRSRRLSCSFEGSPVSYPGWKIRSQGATSARKTRGRPALRTPIDIVPFIRIMQDFKSLFIIEYHVSIIFGEQWTMKSRPGQYLAHHTCFLLSCKPH